MQSPGPQIGCSGGRLEVWVTNHPYAFFSSEEGGGAVPLGVTVGRGLVGVMPVPVGEAGHS